MFVLYWVREDRQGSYNMGSFATRDEALRHISAAKAELMEMCSAEMAVEIEAGDFQVDEE